MPIRLNFHEPVTCRMIVLDDEGEARAARRFKVFKKGNYSRDGESSPIHLLDVSASGAKAHAQKMPRRGDYVFIECGFPLGTARVLWVSTDRFGLKFTNQLTAATLAKILKV